MFEYKVIEARHGEEAQNMMNQYAKEGWRVVSVVYWQRFITILIITLERAI